MRSKDFVTEGLFGDLSSIAKDTVGTLWQNRDKSTGIGNRIKGFFGKGRYGRSTKDQMAADKFIDKFITRGMETLNVAVKQGLVDPESNALSQQTTTKAKQAPKKVNKKQTAQAQPSAPTAAPAAGLQTNPTQNYPNINVNVKNPVQKGLNVSVPNLQTQQIPGQKTAQQASTTQPQSTAAPKAAPAAPKAAPAAPKARAKPVKSVPAAKTQKPEIIKIGGQKISPNDPLYGKIMKGVKEDKSYEKLNLIFENYIQLLEQQTTPPNNSQPNVAQPVAKPKAAKPKAAKPKANTNTKTNTKTSNTPAQQANTNSIPSISQYFKDYFLDDFLYGINMAPAKPKLDNLLKNLPQLYKSGKLKKELEDIGNIAFTLANKKNLD
jgi:hypothetical protein